MCKQALLVHCKVRPNSEIINSWLQHSVDHSTRRTELLQAASSHNSFEAYQEAGNAQELYRRQLIEDCFGSRSVCDIRFCLTLALHWDNARSSGSLCELPSAESTLHELLTL